ncbi:MAG TPA: methyltransferase [Polyangiaceae bacterium]|nr:methyltransferase [Polyangiaceae bacterium]
MTNPPRPAPPPGPEPPPDADAPAARAAAAPAARLAGEAAAARADAPAARVADEAPAARADAPRTHDTLLRGRVAYAQPARGYRVGLEAPLLAAFALRPGRRPPRHVVDLGAGAGAVGLCVAFHCPSASLTLVEREPLAAACARENVERQGWGGRARVVEADAAGVDEALGRGVADLVVSNPPWFWEGHGAASADPARRAARQLRPADLAALVASARQLLGRGGRLCVTFPAPSLGELFDALRRPGLVAKRLKLLHPRPGEPAQVAFVEALAARPGGLEVEAPWFVRGEGEAYSAEIDALLSPPAASATPAAPSPPATPVAPAAASPAAATPAASPAQGVPAEGEEC